jgi:ParB family chromosome partitioning protein
MTEEVVIMSKKRGLNKGRVDMLLSEALGLSLPEERNMEPLTSLKEDGVAISVATKNHSSEQPAQDNKILQQVSINKLMPSKFQPRRVMPEAELAELAESIKQQGVLQPVVVRANSDRFEIVAGERRWRAARIAGLQNIPVIVHKMTDEEAMVIALVENIQRENLNPMEEAYALDRLAKEFGFTHEETAKVVGKSRATISNLLRLLQLHPDVKGMLEKGILDVGHAKVLLAIETSKQNKLAKIVVEQQLSVRDTERLVQEELSPATIEKRSQRPLDPDIARLQRSLSEKMGAMIRILHNSKGRGKIVIKYNSIDELDGILEHIN